MILVNWGMGFSIAVFICSPINGPRLLHVKLPRLCNGHCILLTNNKDDPCLAVNFTPSGFAKRTPHARKGFVVVCDSLGSLLCPSLGAGYYNLPIAQLQNISKWADREWEEEKRQAKNKQQQNPQTDHKTTTAAVSKRDPTAGELLQSACKLLLSSSRDLL